MLTSVAQCHHAGRTSQLQTLPVAYTYYAADSDENFNVSTQLVCVVD